MQSDVPIAIQYLHTKWLVVYLCFNYKMLLLRVRCYHLLHDLSKMFMTVVMQYTKYITRCLLTDKVLFVAFKP